MQRITKAHVEAKVERVNQILHLEDAPYNTPGKVELAGAYGGYAVHRVMNEAHGVECLTFGYRPLADCALFLDGMIAHHQYLIEHR